MFDEKEADKVAYWGGVGFQEEDSALGESSTRNHMVMGSRKSQCFSNVTTLKVRRKAGFYKKLSRGFCGARKSICRGGDKMPVWGSCGVTGAFLWLATTGLAGQFNSPHLVTELGVRKPARMWEN